MCSCRTYSDLRRPGISHCGTRRCNVSSHLSIWLCATGMVMFRTRFPSPSWRTWGPTPRRQRRSLPRGPRHCIRSCNDSGTGGLATPLGRWSCSSSPVSHPSSDEDLESRAQREQDTPWRAGLGPVAFSGTAGFETSRGDRSDHVRGPCPLTRQVMRRRLTDVRRTCSQVRPPKAPARPVRYSPSAAAISAVTTAVRSSSSTRRRTPVSSRRRPARSRSALLRGRSNPRRARPRPLRAGRRRR